MLAANVGNPQSWNRYGYAMNVPTALVDPTGMDNCINGKGAGRTVSCDTGGKSYAGENAFDLSQEFGLLNIPVVANEPVYGITGYKVVESGVTGPPPLDGPGSITLEVYGYQLQEPIYGITGIQTVLIGYGLDVLAPQTQTSSWGVFARNFFSVKNFVQADKDAWKHGYFACVASGGGTNSNTKAALSEGAQQVAEKGAEQAAPSTAGAWYHFTDARFTAWGRSSKVLVPQLAEKIAGVVDIAGWAWTDFDLAKGIATCSPF